MMLLMFVKGSCYKQCIKHVSFCIDCIACYCVIVRDIGLITYLLFPYILCTLYNV